MLELVVHAAYATHTAATGRHTGAALVFLRYFGHHGFGGDQESRNRGCILDRHANDLGRVDNTRRDQVDIFAGLRVEAVVVLILLEDLADDNGTVLARVDRDLAGRPGQRLAHDLDAGLLVVVLGAQPLEVQGGAQQRDAAARDDAFFHSRAGRVHRVIHAILALLGSSSAAQGAS